VSDETGVDAHIANCRFERYFHLSAAVSGTIRQHLKLTFWDDLRGSLSLVTVIMRSGYVNLTLSVLHFAARQ